MWRRVDEVRMRRGGEAEEEWRRMMIKVTAQEMRMVSRVTRKSPYGTYILRNILFDNHVITAVN